LLFFAAISIFGAHGVFNDSPRATWILSLFVNIIFIYRVRRVLPVVMMLLFNLMFVVYAIPHVFFDVSLASMPMPEGRFFLTQVLWQINLMLVVIMLWWVAYSPKHSVVESFTDIFNKMKIPKAPIIFYGLMFVTLVCIFFIKGSIIYGVENSYNRYVENLSEGNGLSEYLLVLFFLSALLCKSSFQKYIWYLIFFLFSIKLFFLGLRVSMLMGIILALWFTEMRFSFGKVVLTFLLGFFVLSFIGLLKVTEDPAYILSSLFYEMHGDYVVSHHGNVLWGSSDILGLLKAGVIDFQGRMDLLFYFILNSVTPSSLVTALQGGQNFAVSLQASGYTSGGGHATTYAYISMGIAGIILFSSLFGAAGTLSLSKSKGFLVNAVRCWFLMTLVTFPRWLSYDIGNFFFRLPLYTAIGYLLIVFVDDTMRSRKRFINA
jgi:hypothetical protein